MVGYCYTAVPVGVDVVPIRVEATSRPGKPKFHIIGLGDNAVRESRDRICAALQAAHFDVPDQILINLAPADIKKTGSGLELAMAWAILASSRQIEIPHSTWVFGELGLGGELKPVRGIVGLASAAYLSGIERVVVPPCNVDEAMLIDPIQVVPVERLEQLRGELSPVSRSSDVDSFQGEEFIPTRSFSDVIDQEEAKWAFEIAAAGGHNVLLVGPPGCGKSMLAERFSSLLPPLNKRERLDVAKILSVVGEPIDECLRGERPFRAPHYIISDVGMIGGGVNLRPGEVSLANRGVLFLDELPEFNRRTLEALRGPLESKTVTISRAVGTAVYPADFQLIAAMNPCPCGRFGQPRSQQANRCRCTRAEISRYLKKLSQPILERIDLHVRAHPVSLSFQRDERKGKQSELERRQRIFRARDLQIERQDKLNSQLDFKALKELTAESAWDAFNQQLESNQLSARQAVRLLRIARTIADLEAEQFIEPLALEQAQQFQAIESIWRYVEAR